MKRSLKLIISISAIIIISVVFKIFQPQNRKVEKNEKGKGNVSAVKILVIEPRSSNETILLPGNVLANNELEIKPEISGKIEAVHFDEGQNVKKNQLLVKISDSDLQANLKKLLLQKKYLEEKTRRAAELLKSGNTSQESYDAAQNALDIINSDIEIIQLQIAKTEIRAPFAGTAGFKNISCGGYASSSSTLLNLYQIDILKIEFSLPEKYLTMIKPRSVIKFKIDGSEIERQAVITAVAPKINPQTRTVNIRALYQNSDGLVRPGNFANVLVNLNSLDNAVLIPSDALLKSAEGEKVFIYSRGKARQQFVRTGMRTQNEIMITEGLNRGDSLIISGAFQLKDGAKVKLHKDKKQAK